jgi:hypothetical protein
VDQSRGLPLFSHGINSFRSIAEATEREQMAQLILSSIAFVEQNEDGGVSPFDFSVQHDPNGTPTVQTFENGTVRYFRAGSGSKIEEVANNRPSANWQAFHDRLIRSVMTGTGWPLAMVNHSLGTGTFDRLQILQAKRALSDRQQLLKPFCKKVITFALGKAIDSGILPASRGWWNWSFSLNQQLSIDLGRDSNALRAEYAIGLKNLTQILGEEGRSLESHLRERAEEAAMAERIRQEVEARTGVTISPEAMRLN